MRFPPDLSVLPVLAILCPALLLLACTGEPWQPTGMPDAESGDSGGTSDAGTSGDGPGPDALAARADAGDSAASPDATASDARATHDSGPVAPRDAATAVACDGPRAGFAPRDLGEGPGVFRGLAVRQGELFASTFDGVWSRDASASTSAAWRRRGLAGQELGRILVTRTGALLTTRFKFGTTTPGIFRSGDGGTSWTTHGEALLQRDSGAYWPALDLVAVQVGRTERLVAGLDGGGLAVSDDDGRTWRIALRPQNCPHCPLLPDPLVPSRIFQGCECPLDAAWIASVDLASEPPVSTDILDPRVLDNRRINSFALSTAGNLFAGVEGGMVRLPRRPDGSVDPGSHRWLFRADETSSLPYVYVSAIWVDPCDEDHVIFAGYTQASGDCRGGRVPLYVYETRDAGRTLTPVTLPGVMPCDAFITFAGPLDAERSRWGMTVAVGLGTDARRTRIFVIDRE